MVVLRHHNEISCRLISVNTFHVYFIHDGEIFYESNITSAAPTTYILLIFSIPVRRKCHNIIFLNSKMQIFPNLSGSFVFQTGHTAGNYFSFWVIKCKLIYINTSTCSVQMFTIILIIVMRWCHPSVMQTFQ